MANADDVCGTTIALNKHSGHISSDMKSFVIVILGSLVLAQRITTANAATAKRARVGLAARRNGMSWTKKYGDRETNP